jgi:hypothetical protein
MHLRGKKLDVLETGGFELVNEPASGAFNVLLMFALGADTLNAEELEKLVLVLVAVGVDVLEQIHVNSESDETMLTMYQSTAWNERCLHYSFEHRKAAND